MKLVRDLDAKVATMGVRLRSGLGLAVERESVFQPRAVQKQLCTDDVEKAPDCVVEGPIAPLLNQMGERSGPEKVRPCHVG